MKTIDHGVTLVDHFRALAANFHRRANHETNPAHKGEYERLADCYGQLAEQFKPLPR